MNTFSIKEAVKDGWRLWKIHWKVITIATVITFVVGFVSDWDEGFSLMALIFFIISFILDMGWTKMLLRVTHGEMPKVRDLIDHIQLFWKYLAISVVTFLIVAGGLILLIIPGIYFGLKYVFASTLVLDKGMGIKEALSESARMTQGIKWKLIGFCIVLGLVAIAGIIALGVGIFISGPVATLAFLSVYKKLSQVPVPQAPQLGEIIA